MKRKKPIRRIPLDNITETLYVSQDEPLIEYSHINELSLSNQEEYRIVFDSCTFEKVTFSNNTFLKAEFIDCVFKNCDLSNNTFTESTFMRVEFYDCKLIGCHIVDSYLEHTLISKSQCRYLDFAENKMKCIDIKDSSLIESNWFENKMTHISLKTCDFTKSSFYKNPFKGTDFSTCDFEQLKADLKSVEGIIIDSLQAEQFCYLLGIKVK